MEPETILRIVLFCGITGFAFFCASYAFHVWRTRNAAIAASASKPALAARAGRWCLACMFLGVVVVMAAAIGRELSPREGVLMGDGIFTVRADATLKLEHVVNAASVQAGDVLARFRCPERQAEVAEWTLKKQSLEAQKQVLKRQPLVPDHELVRHTQNLYEDQRQLEASIRYLLPEQAAVAREEIRDHLDRLERLNSLSTHLAETRKEAVPATAELEKARRYQARAEALASQSAASVLEAEDRITETKVLEAEVARLEERTCNLENEIRHVEASLRQFAECAAGQSKRLADEIARARQRLENTRSEYTERSQQLKEDLKRAELLRTSRLSQVDLEIEQCSAKLHGLQEVMEVKAPFPGQVAYADPAPRAALPLAPVLVLTPSEGFRFRLRLPEREVAPLAAVGSVPLRLVEGLLHHRFRGHLSQWEQLPDEPGYVIAELVCLPPPETIRDLVSGGWGERRLEGSDHAQARLLWRAPLVDSPLFWPGAGLIGVGLVGWAAIRLRPRRHPDSVPAGFPASGRAAVGVALPGPAGPLLAPEHLASGALGRNLEQLGLRLREAIRRQEVAPELVGALEWALDRHQMRAIHHLGIGLDHDEALPAEVARLLEGWPEECPDGGPDSLQQPARRRVERILETIRPELLAGRGQTSYAGPGMNEAHAPHRSSGRTHRFSEAAMRPAKRVEERLPS